MKVAIVTVLLFATVLCGPVRKASYRSSESSEEVVRRPAVPAIRKQAAVVPQSRAAHVQNVVAAAATDSDESKGSSDEDESVVTTDGTNTALASDTTSDKSKDSGDDDDDDNDDETKETEEDESSSESGESSTLAPATDTPVIITDEPVAETTVEPIVPTIVTDADTGHGDNMRGYPGDYKSIVYVEDKSYHKIPVAYKSYEFVGTGKKTAYDMTEGNEVEKSLKVYKAIQVHSDLVEEDTSTPEVESQGLDASSVTTQDHQEEGASPSDATTSTPEEEEEEEESASTSQESEDKESQSSEEATVTPGAADSDSDESDSDESEGTGPDATTDTPLVITAK
uniref:Secreted phosphoprotein 1 n=1 Tax=Monopterus albus TaxID=43700 RepID=A0A3Q3K790_MONAL|nr:osteopontin-like [Monopterus albus]XP_020442063.1 osteopontin-like [Monopterus albus]